MFVVGVLTVLALALALVVGGVLTLPAVVAIGFLSLYAADSSATKRSD